MDTIVCLASHRPQKKTLTVVCLQCLQIRGGDTDVQTAWCSSNMIKAGVLLIGPQISCLGPAFLHMISEWMTNDSYFQIIQAVLLPLCFLLKFHLDFFERRDKFVIFNVLVPIVGIARVLNW
jgi:hypothetical protein